MFPENYQYYIKPATEFWNIQQKMNATYIVHYVLSCLWLAPTLHTVV